MTLVHRPVLNPLSDAGQGSFLDYSFLMYRNTTDVYMLILYLATAEFVYSNMFVCVCGIARVF